MTRALNPAGNPNVPAELIDTHCHLTVPELFDRREQVLADAAAVGVTKILTVACRPEEFAAALNLASGVAGPVAGRAAPGPDRPGDEGGRAIPRLYVATGIHPHEAAKAQEADWDALAATWQQPNVVAAGEMGLDYYYDFSPRDVQRSVFERQLDLAVRAGLPVIIHCREAQADVVEILCRHGFQDKPVVFHCFSGTPEEAAELRSHGWRTSFTGLITFKNAAPQRQACLETPADQLMFETDSPYLSPEPVRRMRPNEPRNLVHTVQFAARLRGVPFEDLALSSTASAQRFFRIPA